MPLTLPNPAMDGRPAASRRRLFSVALALTLAATGALVLAGHALSAAEPSPGPLEVHVQAYPERATPGQPVTFHLFAVNRGETSLDVLDRCGEVWLWGARSDEGRVELAPPELSCDAVGTSPLSPGDTLRHVLTWDQRVWDDDVARRAGPGTYHVNASVTYGEPGEDPSSQAWGRATVHLEDQAPGSAPVTVHLGVEPAEAAPGQPVTISMVAANAGAEPIDHPAGCALPWSWWVEGPSSQDRPWTVLAGGQACGPTAWAQLMPNGTAGHTIAWDLSSPDVPPGTYRVVVGFHYRPADGGPTRTVTTNASVAVMQGGDPGTGTGPGDDDTDGTDDGADGATGGADGSGPADTPAPGFVALGVVVFVTAALAGVRRRARAPACPVDERLK